MKILIPTCRPKHELANLVAEIEANSPDADVIVSGLDASASVNRNHCLDHLEIGETAVMIDDDIEGFYHGWVGDLVKPMSDPMVVMVSARLLNPDCSFGPTCSRCYDPEPEEIEIKSNGVCVLPTAAIAFRHRGHRFDISYAGSGFEDNDWCQQYLQVDPSCKFVQSNLCRLVHLNLMRNQKGKYWHMNQAHFFHKWHGANVHV